MVCDTKSKCDCECKGRFGCYTGKEYFAQLVLNALFVDSISEASTGKSRTSFSSDHGKFACHQ